MYRLSRAEGFRIRTYEFDSYEEAKSWVNSQIEKYKKINSVGNESTDRSFMEFKFELEYWLDEQCLENMDDYLKCKKCSEEDHEDCFCRCEDRNIRVAQENRKRGKFHWNQDNYPSFPECQE